MSGRPSNPSWTIPPFAPDANYPVGSLPWEGLPTKVAWAGASSVGFTPKKNVPAQALNGLFNACAVIDQAASDSLTALYNYLAQAPIQNWPAKMASAFPSSRLFAWGDAAWDDTRSLWVANVYNSGSAQELWYSPTCEVWTNAGSMSATTVGRASVVVDPNTGHWYTNNLGNIQDYDPAASTYTAHAVAANAEFSTGRWFNGQAVFIGYNGTTTQIYTYTTAAGATSRTVPATCPNVTGWRASVKSDGSKMMAIPAGGVGGASLKGMISSDGITWTAITLPTVSGDVATDIRHGNGVWMLSVGNQPLTDPTSKIYTSVDDGVTWTLVATRAHEWVDALSLVGVMWFAAYSGNSTTSPALGMFSLDNGVTWRRAEGFDAKLDSNCNNRVHYNGRQLLARTFTTGTAQSGLGSFIAGLPSAF